MTHRKLLFYIILSAVLTVAIIPYAAYILLNLTPVQFSAEKTEKKNLEYRANSLKIGINSILYSYLLTARNLAENLSNKEKTPEEKAQILAAAAEINPHILALAAVSPARDVLAGSSKVQPLLKQFKTSSISASGNKSFTALKTSGDVLLVFTVPIPGGRNTLLTILSPKIFSILNSLSDNAADNSTLQIISDTGLLIFTTEEEKIGTSAAMEQLRRFLPTEYNQNPQPVFSSTDTGSIYYTPLQFSAYQTNLSLLTFRTNTAIPDFALRKSLKYLTPILLLLLMSVLTTTALYRYIINPIQQIIKMITYVHSGIFNYEMKLNRRGELGLLLKSFNEMMNNLEKRFLYQKRMRQEILLRNRYEEKLKLSRAEAVSLSKAKDEFLTNISHEIRTPLNAIIGFSEKLLLENHDKAFTKSIKTILSESDHLLLLLNDLLDNAKIEADKLDLEYIPFALHKCIHDTIEPYREAAVKKNLDFSLEISKDTPEYVIFDPLRFRQVLVNLLSNAIKFTEKGSITIRTAVTKTTPEYTDVSFYVTDTGIGIPKDKQKSIFNEFSQADGSTTRKYGGTGLGTTISKKLVTLMGGEMCLESEPGKGSTFWFNLSLNTRISPNDLIKINRENSSTPKDNANKFSGTILVAEDYEVNQDLIRSQLEYLGLNVLIADNGRIAVNDCKRVFFDLIFMDLQMPEMGGIEAARRIRINYPHYEKVPIIALTANADKDIRNICKAVGMNGILNKPTHIDELAASLLKWLPRSCQISPISIPEETMEKFQYNTFNPESNTTGNSEETTVHAKTAKMQNIPETEPPQPPPVDFSAAHRLFGNNKMIFTMALDSFINSTEKSIIPDMYRSYEKNDFEKLRQLAHKLKGGAASITAKKLSQIAGELERSCSAQSIPQTPELIDNIKNEFQEIKTYITNYTNE